MPELKKHVRDRLAYLYGEEHAAEVWQRLEAILSHAPEPPAGGRVTPTERDIFLITYADMVRRAGETPLATLHNFLNETVYGLVNTVHILPFYPYTSDDGFSVVDYWAVNPAFGTWGDVRHLHDDYTLMFDAVFNHISASSTWFQAFLRGEKPYTDYFITADPQEPALAQVRRPRTHPLLTPFETPSGTKYVWTTFSADQIDVNAASPDLLLELIRALLFYVEQGADWIRMDAIAYLWKEIGTTCIHLPQTHAVVKLFRDVLDAAAPQVGIITETNVPHDENISYFGDGTDEAQMVYNFSLPPLIVHTFRTGDTTALTTWAAGLTRPGGAVTYFNFLASHDGIGVTPARGLLSEGDFEALVALAEAHGGYVSYKNNADGSQSPYELNINYFDAITTPSVTAQQPETAVSRFLCAQAMMLAFAGVPGIYFHSLFGSRGWRAGAEASGHKRTINREKLDADALLDELRAPGSLRARVFGEMARLIRARTGEAAFHPLGGQRVITVHPGVFALERTSADGSARVLALHNVRGESAALTISGVSGAWRDLLDGQTYHGGAAGLNLTLTPYRIAWLRGE